MPAHCTRAMGKKDSDKLDGWALFQFYKSTTKWSESPQVAILSYKMVACTHLNEVQRHRDSLGIAVLCWMSLPVEEPLGQGGNEGCVAKTRKERN